MKQQKTDMLRKLSMYGFELANGSHNFYALLEFDITNLRSVLRNRRIESKGGSLFAFLLKAIGKCLEEFPMFNSMINLKNSTAFEEVDINIPIEVNHKGNLVNKQYIIRNINTKSIKEISAEIEIAKKNEKDEVGYIFSKSTQYFFNILPKKIVMLILRHIVRNHKRVKDMSGTVFVTSVTMFSNVSGYVIPYIGGPQAASFAIGSTVKRATVIRDEIKIREMINITAIFNHDIVNGAPAARFINRLREYIEVKYNDII